MAVHPPRPQPPYQKAMIHVSAARVFDVQAKVRITSRGLMAIGGLVSSILLSTAVLVGVATRHLPRRDRS